MPRGTEPEFVIQRHVTALLAVGRLAVCSMNPLHPSPLLKSRPGVALPLDSQPWRKMPFALELTPGGLRRERTEPRRQRSTQSTEAVSPRPLEWGT
jgi:hypothetical protein